MKYSGGIFCYVVNHWYRMLSCWTQRRSGSAYLHQQGLYFACISIPFDSSVCLLLVPEFQGIGKGRFPPPPGNAGLWLILSCIRCSWQDSSDLNCLLRGCHMEEMAFFSFPVSLLKRRRVSAVSLSQAMYDSLSEDESARYFCSIPHHYNQSGGVGGICRCLLTGMTEESQG